MAEQHTDQHHTADAEEVEEEPQSMNKAYLSRFDECKHEDIGTVEQRLSEESESAEEKMESLPEGSSPPEDDDPLNSSTLQLDEGSHGDYNRATSRKEQRTGTAEQSSRVHHAGEKRAPETTTSPTLGDRNDDSIDGPDEGTKDMNSTSSAAAQGDGPEKEEKSIPSSQTEGDAETIETIETIGPTTQDTADPEPAAPVVAGKHGSRVYLIAGILGIVLAILGQHLFQPDSPPQKDAVRQIDIFLRQLEKTKTQFPNQRDEVWTRSKIHLLRHLQTAQPSEPVSLILTAGHRAQRTLRCLAQSLASAFSSSLNASVLHIDGAGKASQDSDQVKLDIDSKLQRAFEGDKPVAVIDRFDELPPGSTLIFYRYCDHENAAYKKACLIFTVLLGDEDEIPAGTRLSAVEEMVDDHLQKKFLSSGHPVSFDRMDLDKYGGLWSRISHLILPVAAEESMEHGGCL